MAIEQTGGCLFQRKLTQNMDISICKNSIKETQVARESKSGQKKNYTHTYYITQDRNSKIKDLTFEIPVNHKWIDDSRTIFFLTRLCRS